MSYRHFIGVMALFTCAISAVLGVIEEDLLLAGTFLCLGVMNFYLAFGEEL